MILRPLHDPHDCRLDPDWRDHRLQNVHHELRGWLGAGGGAAACVSSSMLSACWWSHIRCGVVAPPICYRQVSQLKPSWFLGRWRSIAVARLFLEDGLAQLPSLRLEAGALQLAHSESQVEASQGNKKQNKVCEASSCQARFEWRWRDGQSPAIGLQPILSSQFSYPGPPVGLQQIQQNLCEDGPDPGTQDQGCQQPATTATNQHPLQLSSRKLGAVEGPDGFWRKLQWIHSIWNSWSGLLLTRASGTGVLGEDPPRDVVENEEIPKWWFWWGKPIWAGQTVKLLVKQTIYIIVAN